MLHLIVESFIINNLKLECLHDFYEELRVKFPDEYSFIVLKVDQTQVGVALHRVLDFLGEKLLKLLLRLRRLKFLINFNLKQVFNNLFIIASACYLHVSCKEISRRVNVVLVYLIDCPLFNREQIGTENHLVETIIVHMLQDGPLFS